MSSDFKLCIKCDKLVNILDDHDDCYRHRVCNSEFPCEICKSWTSEKRQSVERMIDKARLAATKKQSRSTDVETCPSSSTSSPLTGTRQFVASSLLTRVDNQNNQSLLTGTVTTQSPLTGTGAIQSPLVGTGTFQSNSPVGVGSVHDIHASNIDINAQARTEMSSNPFMWMFNMPNQQDFWKDFVDKRVQEALRPTLLRSAATSATFISNTTTSVSTSVSCTANTTTSTFSNVRRRFDKFSNNNDYEDVSEDESEFSVLARNQSESKSDNGDNENPDQNSVAGTCSDQVFVDHADINNNFGYTNLMCKVASELGITVDSEKSQEVQYQSVSDHLSCDKQNNSSPRCRLPLDGVVLNALHSVNKEFVNKGTLRTFKASDDEKFQISSDHFNQFCTPPHLDENSEEGLTSCNVQQGQNKNFGSKKSHFHFKNRELFLQNIELKKIDSQSRLLLRQISHGVLLTSYIAKVNIDDDRLDALKALLQVFKAMSDVTARIAVNSVKCRRILHIKEMSFKNKSTENKLKQLSTLGPNLFAGKFFDLLHDSAENIRDAKETQHLRKIKVVDKQESKPSNLHVGAKRKVVDGDYSADSAKRFKSSGPHQKHKSNNQDRRGQSSVSDSFQKKGPRQLGFRPQK
jgi:hypothetical protein